MGQEVTFCPKCHREAYRIENTDDMIKVIQGRRTLLNISRSSSVKISLSCPSGHPVKLEIEQKKVGNGSG